MATSASTGRELWHTNPEKEGRMQRITTQEPTRAGWQDLANCLGVDPDLFFPERGASTREAKEVCRGCVVREECLEYALAHGEKFGIWGGLSERERRRIRRARNVAAARAGSATA
jgi:WhiB family redox-sensing transcriptional regulator